MKIEAHFQFKKEVRPQYEISKDQLITKMSQYCSVKNLFLMKQILTSRSAELQQYNNEQTLPSNTNIQVSTIPM